MRIASPTSKTLPLMMVGGSNFGRYPMISPEETWNMIISDNWLVPYAGYLKRAVISPDGEGRGIYGSDKYGKLIVVSDNVVFSINSDFTFTQIGSLDTFEGTVFIAENDNNQIAFCDGQDIFIFNYDTNIFIKAVTPPGDDLDFTPGYVEFQDGYFIAADTEHGQWRLSTTGDGRTWPFDANHVGLLQTKPTTAVATVRFPGQGGLLYVFGQIVAEAWYDTGAQLFPYQRNNFFNIDYGCLSAATIASLENFVVWLASNEKTGPVIMYSNGGPVQKLSTDGIDYKLSHLTKPEDAYGFLFRQDGHMIYQLTFPTDNFSIGFDFNTMKFFNTCDSKMNYHIAKRVVYFNNAYYFVSFANGDLYELNSLYTTFDGEEIPRIRITPTLRLPSTDPFVTQMLTFPIEQGNVTDHARVDMRISIDGGVQFSSDDSVFLQPLGDRINRIQWWNMGWSNEINFQFRFWGFGRFVLSNGEVTIYQ